MPYNNYLDLGAGNYPGQTMLSPGMRSYGNNGYQTAMPAQQTSGTIMTVFVNTEDEVPAYPVQAGTTVLLLCFPAKKFWLKSTSTNGVPEALREFPFEEKTPVPSVQTANTVTREEFDSLSKKIDKLISDLGGGSNG